jgi:hypothetical protein
MTLTPVSSDGAWACSQESNSLPEKREIYIFITNFSPQGAALKRKTNPNFLKNNNRGFSLL